MNEASASDGVCVMLSLRAAFHFHIHSKLLKDVLPTLSPHTYQLLTAPWLLVFVLLILNMQLCHPS